MALTAQLDAITQNKIVPRMFDNIFDSQPLLKRMLKSGQYTSQDGGKAIDLPLNYAETSSAGWFSGSDTLMTDDNESISSASYSWKSVYANITLVEEDKLKNSGAQGVLKLLAAKSMIAEKTLKSKVSTGLYSAGTDAKSIVGLRNIVNTTATIGGISQSTSSWWQGQVDSTTTTLTLSAMNTQFENASIDSEKPSIGLATRSVYGYYYNLLTPVQRFTDSETAKGGFQNLYFNGIPVISDSYCPASHLFFINENHLWLFYHPDRNFKAMEFSKPINQEVLVSRIILMCALASSNNRLHAKFSVLTA